MGDSDGQLLPEQAHPDAKDQVGTKKVKLGEAGSGEACQRGFFGSAGLRVQQQV